MGRYLTTNLLLFVLVTMPSGPLRAEDADARAVMEKVDARDDGDNRTAFMEMVLIDKKGKQRIRQIATYIKDQDQDTFRLMFFLHPADVKDTGFLTYDYEDPQRDDDQWLYLPALRKTKRIATVDKSGSFMGSDLNYSDMTDMELEDYDFYMKKSAEVGGRKVWVIEAVPRSDEVIDETGYTKSILFVRQDIHFVIRGVSWVHKKNYLKYMDVKKLEQIDGIWVATETHVFKKRGKQLVHKTVLRLDDVRFNQALDADLFTVRRIEAGP